MILPRTWTTFILPLTLSCAACARPAPTPRGPAPPAAQAPLLAALRQTGIALRPVGRALPARAPAAPPQRPEAQPPDGRQGRAGSAALQAASARCSEIAALAARLQGGGAGPRRGCARIDGEAEALTVCLGAPLPPPLHRAVVTEIAAGASLRAVSAEEVHGDEAAAARRRAALDAALVRAFGQAKEERGAGDGQGGPPQRVFRLGGGKSGEAPAYEIILSGQGASVDLSLRQLR
jgi:hypothetical protein